MKITGIEKAKGDRYTIRVDGECWYILDAEILLRHSLKTGMEVDAPFLEGLKQEAERRKARERAYYLLGYRDHSSQELYQKLLRCVSPPVAAETVALMQRQGYLNDEAYAQKLARYCLLTKKWGQRRAMQEMLRRGVERETAQLALESCEVDSVEQLKAVIDRKYASALWGEDPYKGRQKVTGALLRLGYGYDDIRRGIAEYMEEHQAEWEDGEEDG